MRKIRVLLLLHELSLTGAPKIALDAFEAMQDRVSLRIVARRGGPLTPRCRRLGPLRLLTYLPPPHLPVPQPIRRALVRPWGALFRHWKPDVIYVNSVASLPMASDLGLDFAPMLVHVHELEFVTADLARLHGERSIFGILRDWPRRYIACSGAVRQYLIESHGIDPEVIATIHEFVREEDFPAAAPARLQDDRLVVGGAGTVEWRKGDTLWLQMAAELKRRMGEDRVRFVWVGLADTASGLQFRITAKKLRVDHLIDFVPITTEPFPHFAGFDVFAMTSWEDPCPIVVLEAMMLGKPVVCFAGSGGAPEEVGEAGIVVEDFSPQAMAAAIACLAESPERRAALGRAARERVRAGFTASVQVPRLLREIEGVIAS